MPFITEAVAWSRRCPLWEVGNRKCQQEVLHCKKHNEVTPCVGPCCMGWRWEKKSWETDPDPKGYCGMFGIPFDKK